MAGGITLNPSELQRSVSFAEIAMIEEIMQSAELRIAASAK